jgi:hypothetical protein
MHNTKMLILGVRKVAVHLTLRVLTGRSPAEIVGSTPTGGMDICLL